MGGRCRSPAAQTDQAVQQAVACRPAVDLFRAFLEIFPLGLAYFKRGGVTEVPEIMQMIVETLELGEDQA